MEVGAAISVADGRLTVSGSTVLSEVPGNLKLAPAAGGGPDGGAFIGVQANQKACRVVLPVGKLEGLRFMCVFRFKLWWMTQRMGTCGREIPVETQFLLVEVPNFSTLNEGRGHRHEESASYIAFLPILEGDFRAVLQGNEQNQLEICLESGDPAVDEFKGSRLVFVGAGSDPFEVIKNAVNSVEKQMGTFCHREKKKMPDMMNWFGWCTWDAFYTKVSTEGLERGLESFKKGGISPKFVIIDDGWQSVEMDSSGIEFRSESTFCKQARLIHIKENYKFQKDGKEGQRLEDSALGLHHIVKDVKQKYALKYIYVWHSITGYWGGLMPGVSEMKPYDPKLVRPVSSPGAELRRCEVLENITLNGVGLVNPEKVFEFYNHLHSYLASAGVDGVKVDCQSILETLAGGYGGRVRLATKFHQALETSVSRNFPDNEIIACMSHNTDSLYSAKKTAVVRASDDFFPRDEASWTTHIASDAYNSMFIGEIMQPDWDMFHSLHPMAEFQGAARAVAGCPIYVSDKPGHHDFNLLRKLVLPDGSVLRAKLPGRPTKDCLFSDPTRDGKSLLKIWNLNDFSGVLGVFNCQGASWCTMQKKNLIHDKTPVTVRGIVRPKDIKHLSRVADEKWTGDTIIYSHLAGEVVLISKDTSIPIELKHGEYEVFTVVPIRELECGTRFAPIGLVKMFNSGGAIKGLNYEPGNSTIYLKVRGCGQFCAFLSARPRQISVELEETEFEYEEEYGLVTVVLKVPEEDLYRWNITIEL